MNEILQLLLKYISCIRQNVYNTKTKYLHSPLPMSINEVHESLKKNEYYY